MNKLLDALDFMIEEALREIKAGHVSGRPFGASSQQQFRLLGSNVLKSLGRYCNGGSEQILLRTTTYGRKFEQESIALYLA